MSAGIQITFDAVDPHALARFWAELLGYEVEDHHDGVTRLLEEGLVTAADVVDIGGRRRFANAAALTDPHGARPRIYLQRVPEAKTAKNRMHLDVAVGRDGLEAAVARAEAIGASFARFDNQGPHRWAVMHDPEDNEFCLH